MGCLVLESSWQLQMLSVGDSCSTISNPPSPVSLQESSRALSILICPPSHQPKTNQCGWLNLLWESLISCSYLNLSSSFTLPEESALIALSARWSHTKTNKQQGNQNAQISASPEDPTCAGLKNIQMLHLIVRLRDFQTLHGKASFSLPCGSEEGLIDTERHQVTAQPNSGKAGKPIQVL